MLRPWKCIKDSHEDLQDCGSSNCRFSSAHQYHGHNACVAAGHLQVSPHMQCKVNNVPQTPIRHTRGSERTLIHGLSICYVLITTYEKLYSESYTPIISLAFSLTIVKAKVILNIHLVLISAYLE
jgi:hypothetical protein